MIITTEPLNQVIHCKEKEKVEDRWMDGKGQGMILVVIEELAVMGKKEKFFDWREGEGRALLW